EGLEPPTVGFGDRCATNCATALRGLGPEALDSCHGAHEGARHHDDCQSPTRQCTWFPVLMRTRIFRPCSGMGAGSGRPARTFRTDSVTEVNNEARRWR